MDLQKKKRSDFSGKEEAVEGEISVLSEDLICEILLRLPPCSLLSSISVSKSWLRSYASPLFHLHYRSRGSSSLLGFFVNFPCQSPFFFPSSPSSVAIPKLGSVQILDSRGGWLLLRDIVTSSLRLFHPIANKTLAVAQPSLQNPSAVFHALLPDPFTLSSRFRILRVLKKPSSCPAIEIFSSESPADWKKVQSFCDVRSRRCFFEPHPVLVNGFVHWQDERQILALDDKSYALSILGLPKELPLYITSRWLGKLGHRLCFAYVDDSVLFLWVLVDRLYCEWRLERRIEVGDFPELDQFNHARLLAFAVGGGLNAVFLGLMGRIFSLDLESRELKEICNTGLAGFEVDRIFPYNFNEG